MSGSPVVAVPSNHGVWKDAGKGPLPTRVDAIFATLPEEAWQRLSAGEGAKGPRLYDWAWQRQEECWPPGRRNIGSDGGTPRWFGSRYPLAAK